MPFEVGKVKVIADLDELFQSNDKRQKTDCNFQYKRKN